MPSLRPRGSGYWQAVVCLALLWSGATRPAAANPEAYRLNEAAVTLTAQGRYEEAAALFTQALRLSPTDGVIRRNLAGLRTRWGHRLLQAGLLTQAQQQYQAALELVPDETAALLGLGDVQRRLRDPRGAVETYRRVIGLDPQNPDGYARLGEAYYQQGDLTAALSEWERALALRPNDAALHQRVDQVQREARVQSGYRSRDSQHFTVIYEGQRREDIGRELLQILEQAYADVGYELGAYPPYEVHTMFYTDADFERATGTSTAVGGFYHRLDGKIRIAVRGLTPGDPQLRAVLYHEYTHALIYAITRGNNPPRWVHEGLAVYMEKGDRAARYKQEAIQGARAGTVPPLDASPYVHGSAAIAHLIERHGLSTIRELLQRMGAGLRFADAFRETFRLDLATFQRGFRDLLVRGD